jgi:uncharacterized protein (TIGR03067 family)
MRRHAWDDVHIYYSAISPDGRLYAAGGDSSSVRVWDVATGKQLHEFAHTDWIHSIIFTPDSKHLFSGSRDQVVRLWDLSTGKEARKFTGLLGIELSPDGQRALSLLPGGGLRCWDVTSGKEVRALKSEAGGRFAPDSKQILTWSGKSLRHWEDSGKADRLISESPANIWSAWFVPGGKQVAVLTVDHTLRLWDLVMGKEVCKHSLGDDLSDIEGVAICPDGHHFIAGHDADNTIRVHDLMLGKECYRFGLSSKPRGLSVSGNGRLAMSGSHRGIAYLFRMPRPPVPVEPRDGNICYLVNADSGRCLWPKDGSAAEDTAVVPGSWLGDTGGGERWRLQKVGENWKLINTGSFLALTVPKGTKDSGVKIVLQSDGAPDRLDQQWRFVKSGAYYRLEAMVSGLQLAQANDDPAKDGTLTQENASHARVQRWIVAEADPEPPLKDPASPTSFQGCPGKLSLLVIAPQRFRKALEPFLRHKSATGIPAWSAYLEKVVKDFPGADDPERIKRAIEYAHRVHGIKYVLLAGDSSLIPVRFRCVNKVANIRLMVNRGFQPAELYYANLYTDHRPDFRHGGHFSNWDRNGNGCHNESLFVSGTPAWGNNPDNVDTCPDVALGRVPVHTEVDLDEYLERVVRYETSDQRPGNFVFLADKHYDGGIHLSEIVIEGLAGSKPAPEIRRLGLGYSPSDALPGGWKEGGDGAIAEAARSAWWISYIGHGEQFGWNHPSAEAERIRQLDNRERWPIVFATACETGKFTAAPPWGRYRDIRGVIHDFDYDEHKGTAWDNETGKSLVAPFNVPRPHPYDFLDAHDQMVGCAWLHNRRGTGAIAYFGEVIVQPDDMGSKLQRWMMERWATGGRTLGDLYLTAQRRYWFEQHTHSQGDFHRAPRHYLCTTNLYGDPSLRLQRVEPASRPQPDNRLVPAVRPAEVFQNFESGNYGNWKRTGTAFGDRPATGALQDQGPVTGFGGKYLVNTFRGGDAGVGTLTSPPFTIHRSFITFRIGGGSYSVLLCMNLLIDGKPVRSSTGKDAERLEWDFWEVEELEGKQAVIEIVDRATRGWGHINIDDIGFADTPPLRGELALVPGPLRGELRAFQGKWTVAASESDGKRVESTAKPACNVVTRNRITSYDAEGRVTQEATLVIVDPTSNPRKMKLIIDRKYVTGGRDVFQAIYRLNETALSWCGTYEKGKTAVPEAFSTKPADGRFLLQMKREPK